MIAKRARFSLSRLFDLSRPESRRVLILNWRDPWHPKRGGAELVTHRIANQLVDRGWHVEWFSASYPGASDDETRDGIRFVRSGGQATCHLAAYWRYRGIKSFDVIVDEINTIPFYAASYGATPVVTLMFQLAREVWLREAPLGLAQVGFFLERFYLRPYKRALIATAAPSAAQSFRQFGLRGDIRVFPIAVDEPLEASVPAKIPERDVVVVGRIAPSKRIEHSIRAAALLSQSGWRGRVHIIGGGSESYRVRLNALAAELHIGDRIVMHGRVSDEKRTELLRTSSALWMTSLREGWGLVITEAARHGTPAVVYDIAGLKDAVEDGVTGYVVPETPQDLSTSTARLFSENFEATAEAARRHSGQFSWSRTADEFEMILVDAMRSKRG